MTWRIAHGYWAGTFPTIAQGSPKRSDVNLDVATWGTDPLQSKAAPALSEVITSVAYIQVDVAQVLEKTKALPTAAPKQPR